MTAVVTSDWLVRGKIETQCKDFNGKGKLTVDDLYSVIKLQVWINTPSLAHRTKINFLHDYISNSPRQWQFCSDPYYYIFAYFCQMKVDVSKDEIRKAIVDLPMDKNYKISSQDFCRTPILSDEVFKLMDRNNDGQISKGELKLARKQLTLKQIDHLIQRLDKDGNGTISLDELKAAH